jgi:hypothetical protein
MGGGGSAGAVADHTVVVRLPTRPRLSPEDCERVHAGLAAALPDLRMRELFRLRPDLFRNADYLVAAVDPRLDRVVGVLASQWVELPTGRPCLHILAQFVGARYRGGSVFRRSWTLHFAELLAEGHRFPEVVVLKTYNPVAYCAMYAFSGHEEIRFHPEPGGAHSGDAGMRRLAEEVAATISPGHPFDPATSVIRGVGVPADLYPAIPACSVEPVSAYFRRSVRPGDRVLCVLHVPTEAGVQAILSALGLLGAGAPPGP